MRERELFPEAVRRQLAPLLNDHGFRLVSESDHLMRFESETMGAEAMFDPRGEVGLEVFRLGREAPWERWTYSGMVGRASVPRLLKIASEQLQAEGAVLRREPAFFDQLAAEKWRLTEEWTAYYAGKSHGRRPGSARRTPSSPASTGYEECDAPRVSTHACASVGNVARASYVPEMIDEVISDYRPAPRRLRATLAARR